MTEISLKLVIESLVTGHDLWDKNSDLSSYGTPPSRKPVVGYYDLSALSMSVLGFPKKVWMFILEFFNFAKPLNV